MMFRRCCGKFLVALNDLWTTRNKVHTFPIRSLQHLKLAAVTMATSSASEHRCRRLDGKVAVVTASTDGCVCCIVDDSVYNHVFMNVNIELSLSEILPVYLVDRLYLSVAITGDKYCIFGRVQRP